MMFGQTQRNSVGDNTNNNNKVTGDWIILSELYRYD